MICPNCGAEGTKKFCENCGTPLPFEEEVLSGAVTDSDPDAGFADQATSGATYTTGSYAAGSYGTMPPMYDSSQKSKGILKQAWDDVVHDANAAKTMLLLTLISLVPILNFVQVGYCLKWGRTAAFRTGDKLPQTYFGNGHFLLGFYIVVVTVVWAIIMVLLAICLPIISWIPLVLAVPLFELALIYVAMVDNIGAGFRVKKLFTAAKRNYGGLWLVILLPAVIAGCANYLFSGVMNMCGITDVVSYVTVYGSIPTAVFSAVDYGVSFVVYVLAAAISVVCTLVTSRALGYWVGRMNPEWVTESVSVGADPR